MTRHLFSLVLALHIGACSVEGDGAGEPPSETCNRIAGVICQQLFDCYSPEERVAAMLPASEEECLAEMKGNLECASQRVDNQCQAGTTYDPARADDCVAEYEALTCDIVREGITDADTPSCALVCE